ELAVSRQRLARWQQHADSYGRQLGRAQRGRAHLLAWLAALHPASAGLPPLTGPGPGRDGAHRLCLGAGGWHRSGRTAPGRPAPRGPGQGQDGAHRLCLVAGGWHLSWRIAPGDLALFARVPPGAETAPHPAPDGDDPAQDAVIRRHTQLLACEGTLSAGLAAAAGRRPPGPPARPG